MLPVLPVLPVLVSSGVCDHTGAAFLAVLEIPAGAAGVADAVLVCAPRVVSSLRFISLVCFSASPSFTKRNERIAGEIDDDDFGGGR